MFKKRRSYCLCIGAIAALIYVGFSLANLYDTQSSSFHKQLVLYKFEGTGLFANFNAVLGLLHKYDLGECPAGIKVDFGKRGYYFERERGKNFWQYYFEPIAIRPHWLACTARIKDTSDANSATDYSTIGWHLSRERAAYLMEKYIKVKPEFLEKTQDFVDKHFSNYMIGVHYRGTDKCLESPRTPYEKVRASIDEAIENIDSPNYKIFIATDEAAFLDYARALYGDRVVSTASLRSSDGKPVHMQHLPNQQYAKGEQALLDCLLLSRCDPLIRTDSCLSITSARFNPHLHETLISP